VPADITVRIRRTIIRIEIERTSVSTVIPITTEIENTRSIEIAIISLKIFLNNSKFFSIKITKGTMNKLRAKK
jgi:hypothetical protein